MLQSAGIDSVSSTPAVMVFKDDTHYVYDQKEMISAVIDSNSGGGGGGGGSNSEDSTKTEIEGNNQSTIAAKLREWVNHERFPSVVEISAGNFHQVMRTKKFIVMAVLEVDKVGRMTQSMNE